MTTNQYEPKDYKNDIAVRWCPGCGDHAILNVLHKAMAELGVPPHMIAVVSGIGCSSRLPYYMNTYGFHTIHGRGGAIATGVKVANPQLTVWQISGDGDCLAIGGNHFIHEVRRNVDLNLLLLNNKIYGLTKGQFSPTSDRGCISKSSPYGTTEDPFIPAELNCMIFNNGIHNRITDKAVRANRTIHLVHGEKMLFGKNRDMGIVQEGFGLKAVRLDDGDYTIDDVLVHDAHCQDNFLHQQLAMMDGTNLPVALGVIRDVDAPTYETDVTVQMRKIQAKHHYKNLRDMILDGDTWERK